MTRVSSDEVLRDAESRMKKTVEGFRKELMALRAGRANPAMLEKITVDYYGTPTPINQLATISVPEPRLMVIQPWDKSIVGAVERAILKSDLGINPRTEGPIIRLVVPPLTEERRQELVKVIRRRAEEERVAIRNIRRDANDLVKEMEKEGDISEDDSRRCMERIQELTDKHIKEIDSILKAKEKEIMEI